MSEEDAKRAGLTGSEPFFLIHKSPPGSAAPAEDLDLHAGAGETGAAAAFFPVEVKMKEARALKPTKVTMNELSEWVKDMKKVTPQGYLGDPAKAEPRCGLLAGFFLFLQFFPGFNEHRLGVF